MEHKYGSITLMYRMDGKSWEECLELIEEERERIKGMAEKED